MAESRARARIILHHRITGIINLIYFRLIKRYHLFSVINDAIYCPDDSSVRRDMNKKSCPSLPTSGLCTFRSNNQGGVLRAIEQHDRDFARQSHPPAQNHLCRVSSMTLDFYWQSRAGPRPPGRPLKQRFPLVNVSVFTKSFREFRSRRKETSLLSRIAANITQPDR